jgi:hypothetical protein
MELLTPYHLPCLLAAEGRQKTKQVNAYERGSPSNLVAAVELRL